MLHYKRCMMVIHLLMNHEFTNDLINTKLYILQLSETEISLLLPISVKETR